MDVRNAFFYGAGLLFLTLAKVKHKVQGYRTPKPFNVSETDRCVAYDRQVVDGFLGSLSRYAKFHDNQSVIGKNVLELGPGSDLGVGMMLLAHGAASYHACDVNELAGSVPAALYDAVLKRIEQDSGTQVATQVRDELAKHQQSQHSRLDYVVRKDFDLEAAFGRNSIDIVFSNAAFEHFDDIDATIAGLSRVCRPGAMFVVSVDMQTHSRWIRDADPNNIYRYSDALYSKFHFRGMPNRIRPYRYLAALKANGWTDCTARPVSTVPESIVLDQSFRDPINQMDYLTVQICGRKV